MLGDPTILPPGQEVEGGRDGVSKQVGAWLVPEWDTGGSGGEGSPAPLPPTQSRAQAPGLPALTPKPCPAGEEPKCPRAPPPPEEKLWLHPPKQEEVPSGPHPQRGGPLLAQIKTLSPTQVIGGSSGIHPLGSRGGCQRCWCHGNQGWGGRGHRSPSPSLDSASHPQFLNFLVPFPGRLGSPQLRERSGSPVTWALWRGGTGSRGVRTPDAWVLGERSGVQGS